MTHRRLAVVGVLAATLLLAGCGGDDLATEYGDGGSEGYVSSDGRITVIPADERIDVPDWGGETDTGDAVASGDLTGGVTVLNFWYAACPPCREEADDLEDLHERFADAGVAFLGVNTTDSAATARTFAVEHGVTYPSVLDATERDVLSAFAGDVPPNAVPTTLVLDADGRVAARFSGLIEDPDIVAEVIDDVLAEG